MVNQILHINIQTPSGYLESILKPVDDGQKPAYVGIVCHPHPLFGGTMHNKVVFKVAQVMQANNIPSLRFNFRGVGHSSGTYDEGRGEMDDVRYALDFMSRKYPGVPVILAGFSFGAFVGLNGCNLDDRVQAMMGLGVPVRWFGATNPLAGCHKPKLFIHGTRDDQAPYEAAMQWFEQVSAPKRIVTVQDADHFFQGRLDEVQAIIANFVTILEEYKDSCKLGPFGRSSTSSHCLSHLTCKKC